MLHINSLIAICLIHFDCSFAPGLAKSGAASEGTLWHSSRCDVFFFVEAAATMRVKKWCFQRWWGAICVTVSRESFDFKLFANIVSWEAFKSLLLYPFFIRTWFQPFSVRDNFHHERFMPWSYRFFTHEISTIWLTDIADSWLECGFLWMFVGGCPDQPTWNTNYTPENCPLEPENCPLEPENTFLEKEKHLQTSNFCSFMIVSRVQPCRWETLE